MYTKIIHFVSQVYFKLLERERERAEETYTDSGNQRERTDKDMRNCDTDFWNDREKWRQETYKRQQMFKPIYDDELCSVNLCWLSGYDTSRTGAANARGRFLSSPAVVESGRE